MSDLIADSGIRNMDLPNTLTMLNRCVSPKAVSVICNLEDKTAELAFFAAVADRLEQLFEGVDLPKHDDLDDVIMQTYDVIDHVVDPYKIAFGIRSATSETDVLAIMTMIADDETRRMSALPIIRAVRRFVEVLK